MLRSLFWYYFRYCGLCFRYGGNAVAIVASRSLLWFLRSLFYEFAAIAVSAFAIVALRLLLRHCLRYWGFCVWDSGRASYGEWESS